MISKQKKRFEVAKEVIDKQLYEHGEEVAHRYDCTPEPIDMINLDGLDYILFLDRQLYNQYQCEINKLMDKVDDLSLHYKEIRDFRDGLLSDMEQSANRRTPCDYPDNDGHYACPFDAQGGYDCRNYCGLGVDE